MYVRGSVTVENCVIIPIFIMLFMSLISIAGYYHDKLVIKGAVELASVRIEQMTDDEEKRGIENIRTQLKEYASQKTLFMKEISVQIEENEGNISVNCYGTYAVPFVKSLMGKHNIMVETKKWNPCKIIRMTEASMEVIGK